MRGMIVVALLLGAAAAQAGPGARQQSKRLWIEGVAAYDLGQLETAIARFEEAYTLDPNPNILYNLAQAHRQAGRHERAIFFFGSYLRNKPGAANRGEVEGLIAELEQLLAAAARSRERPPRSVESPAPASASASPGPLDPRAEKRGWIRDPVGLSLVGGGVLTAGLGAALLVRAAGLAGEAATTLDQAEARARHDSAAKTQTAGALCLAAGGTLAVAGAVKLVLGRSGRPPPVGLSLGRRSLTVVGRF
jgi:tetratricopeptide (TPR) repeat protein